MKKILIFISILLLSSWQLVAQEADDTDAQVAVDFPTRVQNDLNEIKSEKTDGVGIFFKSFWQTENTYSANVKKRIEALYDSMELRKYNVRDYKLPYISTLSGAAANLLDPSPAIITFLDVVEKGLERLEERKIQQMLKNAERILEKKALYYSKYYQLTFDKGTVSFKWIEGATAEALPTESTEQNDQEANTEDDTWGKSSDDSWDSSEDDWGTSSNDTWGDDNSSWDDSDTEGKTVEDKSESAVPIYKTPLPELTGPVVEL